MCGIFTAVSSDKDQSRIFDLLEQCFMKGQTRGPERSEFRRISDNVLFGFHRLAINGYSDEKSNQPFFIDGIYLICNGEIYNHKQILKLLNVIPESKSDCESIIHLYLKYGIEQTLQILDGVFAFVLFDTHKNKLYAARDAYGVRPLFIKSTNNKLYMASEMKQIVDLEPNCKSEVIQFTPGEYLELNCDTSRRKTGLNPIFNTFFKPTAFSNVSLNYCSTNVQIYNHLLNAIRKRVDNTERDIACLLSGGLDSSLVAALVKQELPPNADLHTWSIGFEGSDDLQCAQIAADHIGSIHHSIVVSEQEFLDAIPDVIYTIETYDTTTGRASVGNWLICKKIREQSDAKVVFNGDGADEVMGGYLYFHEAPDPIAFDKESRKLISNIHYFDVLRSDRCISSHGLEARTPYLDRMFVQSYLSIDPVLRDHKYNNKSEKYLIRDTIHTLNPDLLPDEILFRTKEAFSDGVSKQSKSPWYENIQKYYKLSEKEYYKQIYEKFYGNQKPFPYLWMPNFVKNPFDASARTLSIYSKLKIDK